MRHHLQTHKLGHPPIIFSQHILLPRVIELLRLSGGSRLPRHHPPFRVEVLDLALGLVEHGAADVVPEGGVELGVVGLSGGHCISQGVLFLGLLLGLCFMKRVGMRGPEKVFVGLEIGWAEGRMDDVP